MNFALAFFGSFLIADAIMYYCFSKGYLNPCNGSHLFYIGAALTVLMAIPFAIMMIPNRKQPESPNESFYTSDIEAQKHHIALLESQLKTLQDRKPEKVFIRESGWRLPKQGDKVEVISELPKYIHGYSGFVIGKKFSIDAVCGNEKVRATDEELSHYQWRDRLGIGLMFQEQNSKVWYCIPIEYFKPVEEPQCR